MKVIKVNGEWELNEYLPKDTNTINKWFEIENIDRHKAKGCEKKVLSWICRKHDTIQNFRDEIKEADLSEEFKDGYIRTTVNSYDAFLGLFRKGEH